MRVLHGSDAQSGCGGVFWAIPLTMNKKKAQIEA
jgi:hypothetical protein